MTHIATITCPTCGGPACIMGIDSYTDTRMRNVVIGADPYSDSQHVSVYFACDADKTIFFIRMAMTDKGITLTTE